MTSRYKETDLGNISCKPTLFEFMNKMSVMDFVGACSSTIFKAGLGKNEMFKALQVL
jgi:hypothetical protein